MVHFQLSKHMKRVLTLSTSEHGMWNRRFHSQYVKVRVYSSGERGRAGEGGRERGLEGEGVSFSILCSPENPIMKRHSTKSSEPSTETEGTFSFFFLFCYPKVGAWLGQQRHPAGLCGNYTPPPPPPPPQPDLPVSVLKSKEKQKAFFGCFRIHSMIKMGDGEMIQLEGTTHTSTHTRKEVIKATVFFLCGNLTLNRLHQPHSQPHTHTQNQTNYNLSFLFCPFHRAPF